MESRPQGQEAGSWQQHGCQLEDSGEPKRTWALASD